MKSNRLWEVPLYSLSTVHINMIYIILYTLFPINSDLAPSSTFPFHCCFFKCCTGHVRDIILQLLRALWKTITAKDTHASVLMKTQLQSREKWLRHSYKISYNLCFVLSFQWNCIASYRFPPPLFNVEYVRLSDRFCGLNNIEMGGRGKRKQRYIGDWKITTLFYKHSVSNLFARDCRYFSSII